MICRVCKNKMRKAPLGLGLKDTKVYVCLGDMDKWCENEVKYKYDRDKTCKMWIDMFNSYKKCVLEDLNALGAMQVEITLCDEVEDNKKYILRREYEETYSPEEGSVFTPKEGYYRVFLNDSYPFDSKEEVRLTVISIIKAAHISEVTGKEKDSNERVNLSFSEQEKEEIKLYSEDFETRLY